VTYSDLIDQIVKRAGDDSGTYRMDVRRWLNLARVEIADAHNWRSSFVPDRTITTSAATTDGLYSIGSTSEQVSGNFLFDQTNDSIIRHDSLADMSITDADKSVTGNPTFWADAGLDSSNNRQIYLWPIPDAAYVIRVPVRKVLTDVSEAEETNDFDTYFGRLAQWGRCFEAGLDYYYEKDNNESGTAVRDAYMIFRRTIEARKRQETASPDATLSFKNVRTNKSQGTGRFDPAHFNNRGM